MESTKRDHSYKPCWATELLSGNRAENCRTNSPNHISWVTSLFSLCFNSELQFEWPQYFWVHLEVLLELHKGHQSLRLLALLVEQFPLQPKFPLLKIKNEENSFKVLSNLPCFHFTSHFKVEFKKLKAKKKIKCEYLVGIKK